MEKSSFFLLIYVFGCVAYVGESGFVSDSIYKSLVGKKILCDKFVCVFADGAVAELRFCRFVCSYFFAELRKRSLLKSIFVL